MRVVASANLPIGARLNEESMKWVGWPQSGVVEGFITVEKRPEALKELNNAIVRMPIFEGEPIRPEKIADPNGAVMSSLLPPANAPWARKSRCRPAPAASFCPTTASTVIMVKKSDEGAYDTETILSNIRVLAIDQEIQEKEEGQKTVVGTTATLELTPDQAKVIAVDQQMADRLTLALRSVADAQEPDSVVAKHLLSGEAGEGSVQVIKSGVIQKLSTNQSP